MRLLRLLRTPSELFFRLRQQSWNGWAFFNPPALPEGRSPAPGVAALPSDLFFLLAGPAESPQETVRRAEQILTGEYELLGRAVHLPKPLQWHQDPVHGKSSRSTYAPAIPYLNFHQTGDHKFVWEFNRHQHLLILARAYAESRDSRYLSELSVQLDSWLAANPLLRGINWTSALEVAVRSLCWILLCQVLDEDLPAPLRDRLRAALYCAGCFIEHNLSTYFSPNTHLLAEAAVLHALGIFFVALPFSKRWIQLGRQAISSELEKQVNEDGSYIEHAPWYHLFAMDILTFHWIVEGKPTGILETKLESMRAYLAALCGPSGRLPRIGDDDGGRLVYPYGSRSHSMLPAGKSSRTAGPSRKSPRLFFGTGMAVIEHGALQVLFGTGTGGSAPSGHHHCDALTVLVRFHGEEVLSDSGTLTYSSSRLLRDACRLASAHCSVAPTMRTSARTASSFSWIDLPQTESIHIHQDRQSIRIAATVRYADVTHIRAVSLDDSGTLRIEDTLRMASSPEPIRQSWMSPLPLVYAGGSSIRLAASGLSLRLPDVQPKHISLTRLRGASSYGNPTLLYRATRLLSPSRDFHLQAVLESVPV